VLCLVLPVSWDQEFPQPVPLPKGQKLRTLRDAATHIFRLPKSEYHSKEWQIAMHCLIEAADNNGPLLFARLGVMMALNRHVKRAIDPSRKDTHWGKRKLARES
jgi:hypothetical protein